MYVKILHFYPSTFNTKYYSWPKVYTRIINIINTQIKENGI